ncbi:Bcr/CflA family efflux MFS transporter [Streptomyces physcomitrii]|uniref:multidrug effflux MFS transporter n=1 Tax=Streptomyces physcomitrii TaxID=2724184 RepID=UPI0033E3D641
MRGRDQGTGERSAEGHIAGVPPGPAATTGAPGPDTGDPAAVPGPRTPVAETGPAAGPEPAGGGAPAPKAARRTGLLVTFVLGGLSAVPPLSMDLYLPSLPEVTDSLHTSAATVQLTLTACLAGLALGQLVIGPLSDRWGRRRPLLTGLVLYVLATAACALAPTAGSLTVFRLIQGLAGSAGVVIARAVVRDLYDGMDMARFFSTLMLISGAAPIVAPLVGSQVLRLTDWRGVFVLLTAVGLGLTLLAWRALPETLPPERRHSGGVGQSLRAIRGLLADRVFTGYMICGGFAFGAVFTYISASPFVIQEIYGASAQTFSLLFGLNAVGLIGMGQVNGKILVGRVSLDKVLACGLGVSLLATLALIALVSGAFGDTGLVPFVLALFVMVSAMGVTSPNTNALALLRTPHSAGSASALLGTSAFLFGSLLSPLAGVAGEDTALPMTLVQLGCVLAAIGSYLGLCRPWRSPRQEVAR